MKYILFLILLILLSCSQKNERVAFALEQADSNRTELEKVLEHYEGDSLKYKAAVFLIENMPYYGYPQSAEIDSIKGLLSDIFQRWDLTEAERQKGIHWQQLSKPVIKHDVQQVTAAMLIENIDLAFNVWQTKPWNKHLPFDDFCELILPYRIAEEPLTQWRKRYYDKYNPILDSLYQGTDVVEACNRLSNYLKTEKFYYFVDFGTPRQGADFQLYTRIGTCREACDITTYVMRSVGIPVTTDIYPYSPEFQSKHEWNVVRDTTGKYLPFWYEQFAATRDVAFTDKRKKGKVKRMTYAWQGALTNRQMLPPTLRNPFVKDVTEEYFGKNQVNIPLQKVVKNAFIGVFTARNGWYVVGQGKIENSSAIFENIEPFVIYQPLSYENNELTPIAYPFMLKKGEVHFFQPQENQTVALTRKYPLRKNSTARYKNWLLGTQIKASNQVDFSFAERLHLMQNLPPENVITIPLHPSKPYHYFQYEVPKDSVLSIAEIHFYDKNNREITFDTIYSNGKPWKDVALYQLKNCTDNDPVSFFNTWETGTSIFFKSNTPQLVSKVILIPRNDDNFIREGDKYELFYNNGSKGWTSLGIQKASDLPILYFQAPKNAVLWLKNLTRGKEEQLFFYDNRQVFPTFEEEKILKQNKS